MSGVLGTVNAVLGWLNGLFGLGVPTLPLVGWPLVMISLWNMAVSGAVPPPISSPDCWVINIDGDLDGLLPDGATLQVTDLQIVVTHPDQFHSSFR